MDALIDNVIISQDLKFLHLTKRTMDFLCKLGKFEKGDTFALDELRSLYATNKSLFFHVVNELSLYGCNFHSKKANTLFPPDVSGESEILVNRTDDLFSPFELYRCKLWNLCNSFGIRYKKDMNGIFVERLIYVMKNSDNNIRQRLLDIGFETELFKPEVEEAEEIAEKEPEYNSTELSSVISPDFFVRLVCFIMCGGPYVYSVLNKAGYYKFEDLLHLNSLEKIYDLMDDEHSYLNGKLLFELSVFMRDLSAANETLSNHGFSITSLFEETDDDMLMFIQNQLCTLCIKNNENGALECFDSFRNIYVSGEVTDYLKVFNINSFSQLGKSLLEKSLDVFYPKKYCFGISNLNPYIVVESVISSIKEKSSSNNPTLLDNELMKVRLFDLADEIENKICSVYRSNGKTNKVIDILTERSNGKTLEEIGKKYNVTRERIRQIEAKHLERNNRLYLNALHDLFGLCPFFDLNETKKIVGLYNFTKSCKEYVRKEDFGLLMKKTDEAIANQKLEENFINNKANSIFDMEVEINNYKFLLVPYFISNEKKVLFDPYPNFHATKSVSMVTLADEMLEEKGIKGFDLNKDLHEARERFKPYEKEGEKPSDRVVQSRMLRVENIINVGSSIIAKSKFLTDAQKETCKRIIKNYPINKDYGTKADEIFEAHKKELLNVGIDNYYFFYGVCSYYRYGRYYYAGRSLRIFLSESHSKSLVEMVESYMLLHGPIVKSKELQNAFGVKEVAFEQVKIITKYDSDSYILKEKLFIYKNELRAIKQLIDENIRDKGYCLSKDILESRLAFDSSFNSFLSKNFVKNSGKRLVYLLETVFERNYETANKYNFSHHIDTISLISNPIKTLPDLVLQHFGNEEFTRQDFDNFLDDCELGGDVRRKETIKKYLVLVDEDLYVAAKEYNVDRHELNEINKLINERFSSDPAVTTNDVINYLKVANFDSTFKDNPIGLCTALSSIDNLDWIRPRLNINLNNKALSVIVANVKLFGTRDITLKDVFIKVVLNENKTYMSYNDIDELLRNYGLISKKMPYDVYLTVFEEYIEDGLVVCK
jgi:hypothetical protein